MIYRVRFQSLLQRRFLALAVVRRPFSAAAASGDESRTFLEGLRSTELAAADIVDKPPTPPLPTVPALPIEKRTEKPTTPPRPSDPASPIEKRVLASAPAAASKLRPKNGLLVSDKKFLELLAANNANDVNLWHQLRWTATDPVGRRMFLQAGGLEKVASLMSHVHGLYPLTAALAAFNVWARCRSTQTALAVVSSGWPQAAAAAMARQAVRGNESETVAKYWRATEFLSDGLHALLKSAQSSMPSTSEPPSGSASSDSRTLGRSSSGSAAEGAHTSSEKGAKGPDAAAAARMARQAEELAAVAPRLAAQLAVPSVLEPLMQAIAAAEASYARRSAQHDNYIAQVRRAEASGDGKLHPDEPTVAVELPVGPPVRLLASISDVLVAGSKHCSTTGRDARVAAAIARQAAANAAGHEAVSSEAKHAPATTASSETAPDLFEAVVRQLKACGVLAAAVRSIAAAELLAPGSGRSPAPAEAASRGKPNALGSDAAAGRVRVASSAASAAAAGSSSSNGASETGEPDGPAALLVDLPSVYLRLITPLTLTSRAASDALFEAGAGEAAAAHLVRVSPRRLTRRQGDRFHLLCRLMRSMDMTRQRLSYFHAGAASDLALVERCSSILAASAAIVVPLAKLLAQWRRGDDCDYAFHALALLAHLARRYNTPAADAVGAAAAETCRPDGTLVFSPAGQLATQPMFRSVLAELEMAAARHRRNISSATAPAALPAKSP